MHVTVQCECQISRQTWEVLGRFISLMGQPQVLQHVLHLLLSLRYRSALQQGVEEDMLLYSHADRERQTERLSQYKTVNVIQLHICKLLCYCFCWLQLCWKLNWNYSTSVSQQKIHFVDFSSDKKKSYFSVTANFWLLVWYASPICFQFWYSVARVLTVK